MRQKHVVELAGTISLVAADTSGPAAPAQDQQAARERRLADVMMVLECNQQSVSETLRDAVSHQVGAGMTCHVTFEPDAAQPAFSATVALEADNAAEPKTPVSDQTIGQVVSTALTDWLLGTARTHGTWRPVVDVSPRSGRGETARTSRETEPADSGRSLRLIATVVIVVAAGVGLWFALS